jgi:glycosyltransferase involved in cell wall biosynthesis
MTQDGRPQAEPLSPWPVICVSHGFQTNYERGFCNGLAAHGMAVTLIGSDRTDVAGLRPGVSVLNLRGSQRGDRARGEKALNLLRYHLRLMGHVLRHRGSVVHVMGLIWPVWLCGVLQGVFFRLVCRRYVLTVHDLLPEVEHRERYRRVCGWSYRLADHVVVHTSRMKAALINEFGVPADRITVMEHGIEPQPPSPGPLAPAPHRGAEAVLLAFGAVTPRKGTDLLLQALVEPNFPFRLVIAGACVDEAWRRRLLALIATHPRRDRIQWHDNFIDDAQADALLRSADALVLAYRHIDQSGVLFQALRYGIPVVATRVGQFERYVTAAVGELAPAEDVDGLRDALQRWYARRDTLSGERIREIGHGYEWPTTVGALSDAYGARR